MKYNLVLSRKTKMASKLTMIDIITVAVIVLSAMTVEAERQDGDLLIGAVIPISKQMSENGTCTGIDYEGLAVSEAIRFAIKEINKDNKLLGVLTIDRKLGYDIQDTCGSIEQEKDIAYGFNGDRRNYKPQTPGLKKPVSAVIGEFKGASAEAMKLLNFEKITQVSYAPENAKLKPDGLVSEDIQGLLSVYPEDVTKMKAVASTLEKLKVEYTALIARNDVRGKKGEKMLQDRLKGMKMCLSDDNMASNDEEIKKQVRKLKKNSEVKIVVLHCDVEDAMTALVEAARLNMTDVVWISTVSMEKEKRRLSNIMEQARGMMYVKLGEPDSQGFKNYMENKGGNFLNESSWMREAVKLEGGDTKCAQSGEVLTKNEKTKCKEAIDRVKMNVLKYSNAASYGIDAVYSIARGLQTMLLKKSSSSLVNYIQKLDFQVPLTQSKIHFNPNGQAIAQSFVLYNIQGNLTLKEVKVGAWKRDNEPSLELSTDILRFKQGDKMAPISKCSKDCLPGEEIIYPETGPKCCWTCERCPNGTVSNRTNSECFKCKDHQTPNPQQSTCYNFKQLHMKVKNPVSEFTLFLLTIGLLFTLFTMFIFNQNKDCEVMQMADNATMQGILLGIIIVLTSSVVLMFKPAFPVCITYAALFNVGLTVILGALLTKTWVFRQLFYGSNEKPTACCSKPGLFVVLFLVLIQVAILGIGFYKEKVVIVFDETGNWDVRYIECSYFRGMIFWVSYGYNIFLSVLINFFNCGVPNVEARFGEYNWLCVTCCSFYGIAFFYITSFWAFPLLQKIETGVVLTVLHCFLFLLAYFYPKLHMVLFMNRKDMEEIVKEEKAGLFYRNDDDDEEAAHSPTSGIDVFKNKIVQLNYEPEDDKTSN